MAQYSKTNFKTQKNNTYPDSDPAGATTRAKHRSILEDVADSAMFLTDNFIDEDSFASDSATKAPSQASVKAYVDGKHLYFNNEAGLERKIITGDLWQDVTAASAAVVGSAFSDSTFTIVQNNSIWELEAVVCGIKTDYSAAFTARRKGVFRRDGSTTTFVGNDAAVEVVGTADVSNLAWSSANQLTLTMGTYSGASYKVSAYAILSRFTT